MIKIENTEVFGWEATIRGMRNPKNSWDKSDSYPAVDCKKCGRIEREGICTKEGRDCTGFECYDIGENDLKLMQNLSNAGNDHGKFLRMITVTCDITAPLYWWKEFDTYKVGTVANSCSTMHKIHDKEFTADDFSYDQLDNEEVVWTDSDIGMYSSMDVLGITVDALNYWRKKYLEAKRAKVMKHCWWQMIQLLPSSYNQKRTVQINYQVAKAQRSGRRHHKLDEWHDYCDWLEDLPYFKEICLGEVKE